MLRVWICALLIFSFRSSVVDATELATASTPAPTICARILSFAKAQISNKWQRFRLPEVTNYKPEAAQKAFDFYFPKVDDEDFLLGIPMPQTYEEKLGWLAAVSLKATESVNNQYLKFAGFMGERGWFGLKTSRQKDFARVLRDLDFKKGSPDFIIKQSIFIMYPGHLQRSRFISRISQPNALDAGNS